MNIKADYSDGRLTVSLGGELDHHGAKAAVDAISEALDRYLPRDLVLDLGELGFMDSSGIAVLLRADRRMRETEGHVEVVGVPVQAGRVLQAAGLHKLIPMAFGRKE